MPSVKGIDLDKLTSFYKDNSCLNIVQRKKPYKADVFFEELLLEPLNINKIIIKKTILEDIKNLLNKTVSKKIQNNIFYHIWLKDMTTICKIFSDTLSI